MTRKQRIAILEHYNKGGILCCDKGLEFLKTVLGPRQAEEFNAWAYEELECRKSLEYDRYWTERLKQKLLIKLIYS